MSEAVTRRKRIKFEFAAEENSEVYLAGSFNGWNPSRRQLTLKNGRYTTTLALPSGQHEYKFVVNGVWCVDPECEAWTPNTLGTLNSVLNVA